MPIPTLTQTQAQAKRELVRNQGIGFFNDDLEKTESNEPLKPAPSRHILGEFRFNTAATKAVETAKNTVVDAFGEAFDLGKYIFTGDTEAIGVSTVSNTEAAVIQPQAPEQEKKEDSPLIQEIQAWLDTLKQNQSVETAQNKFDEAVRHGGPVSKEEARELGHQDNESAYTLNSVANKRAELIKQQTEAKENAPIPQSTGKALGENALIKTEGNGGLYSSVGDANLG